MNTVRAADTTLKLLNNRFADANIHTSTYPQRNKVYCVVYCCYH